MRVREALGAQLACPRAGRPRCPPRAASRRRSARRCRASAPRPSPPRRSPPGRPSRRCRARGASRRPRRRRPTPSRPRPIQRAHASAAYSVVRTSSMARLRSGRPRSRASAVICGWARIGSDHPRRLARVARRWPGAGSPAARSPGGRQQADEVAVLDRDADVRRCRPARPRMIPLQRISTSGDHPHDHRDLARLPGELVPAGDDPGQDERRDAGEREQDVERARRSARR